MAKHYTIVKGFKLRDMLPAAVVAQLEAIK